MHLFWYHSSQLTPLSIFRCTDYKRQDCRNKWVYFCNSRSSRTKRSSRVGRLFWDKISRKVFSYHSIHLELLKNFHRFFQPKSERRQDTTTNEYHNVLVNNNIDDDNDVNNDTIQSDSGQCWRFVKQCSWVKYNTVCQNKPVTTCKVMVT